MHQSFVMLRVLRRKQPRQVSNHSHTGPMQHPFLTAKFRAVNKLVAHGAELVSAAVLHCTRRSITLRDDDESVTGDGNPSLLCRR